MNDNAPFPVVGITASVGGLRALEDFFKPVPANRRLAFVVVTHLAPDHEGFQAKIPARHAGRIVQAASDGQKVEAIRDDLLPSNASLTIARRRQSLHETGSGARERMDTPRAPPHVTIFATDVAEHALAFDREVRDLCVFSPHNGLRDPPFSRIDLISCRNVLIYFGAVTFGLARKQRTIGDATEKNGVRRRGHQRRNRTQPFRRRHFRLRGNGFVGAARNSAAASVGNSAMTRGTKRPPGGAP